MMNPQINYRFANISDLPQIVKIYNESIPHGKATADIQPQTIKDREHWFSRHSKDQYPIWMIEYQELVMGWMALNPFYGRPAYRKTAEVSIYLSYACHGKGLGKMALEYLIKEAPQFDFDHLTAYIFAHNEPSISLFSNAGFETWGRLPGVAIFGEERRDLLILGRLV